jgi:hypothetical protein
MPASFRYHGNTIISRGSLVQMHPPGIMVFEDFLVDVLADTPYVNVGQTGTPITAAAISATAGAPVAQHGGWLAGGTDDVDAEIDEIELGGLGSGAGTPWMRPDQVGSGGVMAAEWAFVIPTALTTRQYYVGFADDPTEGTGTNGALNIQTGYTVVDVDTDAAGWIFSSLATHPTQFKWAWTKNNAESTPSAATEIAASVADTWYALRVEIDNTGAAWFSYRTKRGGTATVAGGTTAAVTKTVPLLPLFTAAPTTTTSVPWAIDYGFGSCTPVAY